MKINYRTMKQVGAIVFGGGLNARWWIEDARAHGYAVLIRDGFAELYREV